MIGRNLGDVEILERALIQRSQAIRARRRLPRGESVQDLVDELEGLDRMIDDCKSAKRELRAARGGDLDDSVGGVE